MNASTLTLDLLDGKSAIRLTDVSSLVASDASGQFGIWPGHAALVTVLEPGLFRYRQAGSDHWRHGACTGGLLHCLSQAPGEPQSETPDQTLVRVVSRRFILGELPEALQTQLEALLAQERNLRLSTLDKVSKLDLAFYKRMQQLAQTAS